MTHPVALEQVPINHDRQTDVTVTDLEMESVRIAKIAKKIVTKGALVAIGVFFGTCGTVISMEIAGKTNGVAVPKIFQLVPIMIAVGTLCLYAIVAIPIILCSKGIGNCKLRRLPSWA